MKHLELGDVVPPVGLSKCAHPEIRGSQVAPASSPTSLCTVPGAQWACSRDGRSCCRTCRINGLSVSTASGDPFPLETCGVKRHQHSTSATRPLCPPPRRCELRGAERKDLPRSEAAGWSSHFRADSAFSFSCLGARTRPGNGAAFHHVLFGKQRGEEGGRVFEMGLTHSGRFLPL